MDKFLKNLLTFLDETKLEDENVFLRAAKNLLADEPGESQKTVREKAGFLALLNLLRILQMFFDEALPDETPQEVQQEVQNEPDESSPTVTLSAPRPKSRFPYHKPGLGIYHNLPVKSEPI